MRRNFQFTMQSLGLLASTVGLEALPGREPCRLHIASGKAIRTVALLVLMHVDPRTKGFRPSCQ